MKQIKHIFILVTIVIFASYCTPVSSYSEYEDCGDFLLQQIINEIQDPYQREERLLPLLTVLLKHGQQTGQPILYAQSVFKLFGNMIKGVHYIPDYSVTEMLDGLNDCMGYYLNTNSGQSYLERIIAAPRISFDDFQTALNNKLYFKFNDEYELFRSMPEQFLYSLSFDLAHIILEEMNKEKLRSSMMRFLELALSKVVWAPEQEWQTWESVKRIADSTAILFENNVLNDVNDLDDLFWSLTYRYSFFLELTATMLPLEFYERVKNDLVSNDFLFLTLAEQDDFIEPKIAVLQRTLIKSENSSRALSA